MVFGAGGVDCVGSLFGFFHVSNRLRGGRRYGGNLDSVNGGEVVLEEEGKSNYASPALGVVAKLMGLDAMPEPGTVDSWGVRGRSRSMTSVERRRSRVMAWSELSCLNKSSSFHELRSSWLSSENDGFWVLNFGDDDDDSNKKTEEIKMEACLAASEEEGFNGRKTKIDSDSSSQNSSPVSVLDRVPAHHLSFYTAVHQVSGPDVGYCNRTGREEDSSEVNSRRNACRIVEDHRNNNNNNHPSSLSPSSRVGGWGECSLLALEDAKKIERWVIRDWMKMNYYLEDLEIEIEIKMVAFLVQGFVEQLHHTFLVKY